MNTTPDCKIELQSSDDADDILALHEVTFGPGRFARTAFLIRENASFADELCFTARHAQTGELIGSVILSHITIGDVPSLLLGPLTVTPIYKSKGVGKLLMRKAAETAKSAGYKSIILVGDEPYYGPLGFKVIPRGQIQMPGPVDPERLLGCVLEGGEPFAQTGEVRGARP